jgi:GDP-D-mannose dehydratase
MENYLDAQSHVRISFNAPKYIVDIRVTAPAATTNSPAEAKPSSPFKITCATQPQML